MEQRIRGTKKNMAELSAKKAKKDKKKVLVNNVMILSLYKANFVYVFPAVLKIMCYIWDTMYKIRNYPFTSIPKFIPIIYFSTYTPPV